MEAPLVVNDDLERINIENNADNYQTDESDKQKRSLDGSFNKYLVMSLILAVLGGSFQFGWAIGLFNTPVSVIKDFYREVYSEKYGKNMTNTTLDTYWSITNGLMPLGGMIGGISSGFIADTLGRKSSIIYVNVFILASSILNIVSKYVKSYEILMLGRFLVGIGCGFFTGIVPLYLSECAPRNLRGFAGTMNQLFITIGILTTNILGLPELLGTKTLWPFLVGASLVPILAHFILAFLSESPKYLFINKGNKTAAESALIKLRNSDMILVNNEIEQLSEEKEQLLKQKQVTWSDFIKKKTLRRPLVVTIVVQMSQQLSGINAVIFYSTSIFESAGLKDSWPIYATIFLSVVQVIMTIVSMLIVDKAGRRVLLIVGMMGMCVNAFGLALTRIYGGPDRPWLNYITVVCALIYIIFFSIGPGSIPWLITPELFGSEARGKATSLAVLINWLSNFIVTVTFPFIESAIGSYSFIIFGVLLVFFSIFMLLFVPETKNKATDEILNMFYKHYVFLGKDIK